MDDDFNIKIADFGFAGPLNGRIDDQGNQEGFLHTNLGTPGFKAPEMLLGG